MSKIFAELGPDSGHNTEATYDSRVPTPDHYRWCRPAAAAEMYLVDRRGAGRGAVVCCRSPRANGDLGAYGYGLGAGSASRGH